MKTENIIKISLCCLLTFCLCLTLSSLGRANDFLDYMTWFYTYNVNPWDLNLNAPLTMIAPLQGRLGIQSQAPIGVQVLSSRNRHVYYDFWAMAIPSYLPYQMSQGQSGPIGPKPYDDQVIWFPNASSKPPLPFWGDKIEWRSTALGMTSEVYWSPGLVSTNRNL
jgi:hypothetical protein